MATEAASIPFQTAGDTATLLARRTWAKAWPPLGAIALFIFAWQIVVWLGLWPDYLLPGTGPSS